MMDEQTKLLLKALNEYDLEGLEKAINQGADINFIDENFDSPLVLAIDSYNEDNRIEIIRLLIKNGADVNFLGEENCGVVFQAVLLKNVQIIEEILLMGANPNFLMDTGESLYDWAEFDYRYDAFDLRLPIQATEDDKKSEDAWLSYLDKCAEMKGVFKPEFLRVLRRYGAKTKSEMKNDNFLQSRP